MRETDGRGEGRMEGGKRRGREGRASTVREDGRGHGTAATRQDEARCLSPAQAAARLTQRPAPGPRGRRGAWGLERGAPAAGQRWDCACAPGGRRLSAASLRFKPQKNGGPALRLFHGDPVFSGAGAVPAGHTVRPQGQGVI